MEGKNVTFEARAAQGDMTRVPKLAAELLQQKPHLVLCTVTGPLIQQVRKHEEEVIEALPKQ